MLRRVRSAVAEGDLSGRLAFRCFLQCLTSYSRLTRLRFHAVFEYLGRVHDFDWVRRPDAAAIAFALDTLAHDRCAFLSKLRRFVEARKKQKPKGQRQPRKAELAALYRPDWLHVPALPLTDAEARRHGLLHCRACKTVGFDFPQFPGQATFKVYLCPGCHSGVSRSIAAVRLVSSREDSAALAGKATLIGPVRTETTFAPGELIAMGTYLDRAAAENELRFRAYERGANVVLNFLLLAQRLPPDCYAEISNPSWLKPEIVASFEARGLAAQLPE